MSKRLLFASYHFYLDPSNGASITTREILLALTKLGWDVHTFCGCGLDFQHSQSILQLLADRNIKPKRIVKNSGSVSFSLAHFLDDEIRSSVFLPEENNTVPSHDAGTVWLHLVHEAIIQVKPDILVTYGGYWLGGHLLRLSHAAGVKNVMLLQNFAYTDATFFQEFDLTIVPSQFASDYYAEKSGISSVPILPMIDWHTVLCESDAESKKYVTFVNPDPNKGVYVFAQIAKQLWERRPDIPLLVVEGRCGVDWLAQTGVDLRGLNNLNMMANTPDPRDFYKVTRIMLVPSLFMESFGRVAAEAMINGIPVIGSNRGALPEVIGDAGLTLEIPAHYTPETRIAPTPEEIEPWVDAVITLWDNAEQYQLFGTKGKARAEYWQPDRIAQQYDSVLSNLLFNKNHYRCDHKI
ncbi:MAG: glycosyltransferase [Planctomycetaceae bacterium]|nr:glycosyltransferase [Planctomycetaceae bacterium]